MEQLKLIVSKEMRNFLIGLIGIWLLYALLSLLAPDAQTVNRYGLSLAQTNLLRLTILLPLLFIWITALFCVVRFRQYTRFIAGSLEERGFRQMTKGFLMLLLVIIVPNFITIIATYYPHSQTVQMYAVIARNYVQLLLYLFGFWYLWQGSRHLLQTISVPELRGRLRIIVFLIWGALIALYALAVFHNDFRSASPDPMVKATYYLPDPMIILTIIIPYALVWLFGAMAIINILSYAKNVPGVIYRSTFNWVAYGLSVTIALLISLQFLSQANAAFSAAALKIVLLVIYILLLMIAVGYLLIAKGAKKLTVIEEVS